MKVNLNSYILDSVSYLTYICENNQIHHVDYDKYIQSNQHELYKKYSRIFDVAENIDINIFPYIYTLEMITEREQLIFKKFFCNHLCKLDNMRYDIETGIDEIAGSSIEHIVMFIATMQYFFL